MSTIQYDCRWTSEVDDQFIKDWTYVERSVFGKFSDEYIKRKYFENIYGDSLLLVAYLDGKAIGAYAFWRNDVNGEKAFFSSDLCVMEEGRGKGVMTGMINVIISKVPAGCLIFGSPNTQSYPGVKKMKWNCTPIYISFFVLSFFYLREYRQKMPLDYAKWWIVGQNKYHIKRGRHYFLVAQYSGTNRFVAFLLAEVDKETAIMYPRYRRLSLILYRSQKRQWYMLRGKPDLYHIGWQCDPRKFPYWKVDGFGDE